MATYPTIKPHTIVLIGDPRTEEARAAGVIEPGDLLVRLPGGTVARHTTVGGFAERIFAKEDALQGRGIGDNYAAGDLVNYAVGEPGECVIYAWLSSGEHAVIGSRLSSSGDGTLRVAQGNDVVLAMAEEEVNASDSLDERIRVRLV